MESLITITTAAANTALTTLETVKSDLGIESSDEDSYLGRMIGQVTEQICGHLLVAAADDGTCTLGRESMTQTYRLKSRQENLFISRWLPRNWVMSISAVTENDVVLSDNDFEIDAKTGILTRLSGSRRVCWPCGVIAVDLTAGWLLPDDTGRDLPVSIESAAIAWVKFARANKTRDASLRSENILGGLYSYQLFAPSDMPNAIPADVAKLLEPYVNVIVA